MGTETDNSEASTDTEIANSDSTSFEESGSQEGNGKPEGEGSQGAGNEGSDSKDEGADKEQEGDGAIPETYEFNMPEGVVLDEGLAELATPVFKELNLSQEQADKLASVMIANAESRAEQANEAFSNQLKEWDQSLRKDSEFGGDNYDTNVAKVAEFIDATVPESISGELKQFFDQTGAGNHPALVKYIQHLAVTFPVGEDDFSGGKGGNTEELSNEDILYGNT
jgi:hypothetical protein